MKVELSEEDIKLFSMDEVGRAYLTYNDEVGGEPFGYSIGMPVSAIEFIDRLGGLDKLYQECIKRKITWEELLGWSGHSDELPEIPEELM